MARCRKQPRTPRIVSDDPTEHEDGPFPGVSFVMPVLNEAGYVEAAIASILGQDYPGEIELILALGPSSDGTTEIVHTRRDADARIRVVENPGIDIPSGLNRAIAVSRHPIVARVDAHAELPVDYARRGVRTLLAENAASVGGVMVAEGVAPFQRAVARGYNSRLGLGGGAYHSSASQSGPAESAYLGIMRADALAEVGGYDETLKRGEDWDLNRRLRAAGHEVWLDAGLRVVYRPRGAPGKLARQFLATGTWRAELVRRRSARHSIRYFAPPALLVSLLVAALVGVLQLGGVLSGGWSVVASVVHLPMLAYLLVLLGASLSVPGSLADRLRFVAVLLVMHLSWGAGFIRGAVGGARGAVDTSRLES